MGGPAHFQMWMVLLLGTMADVGRAQVSTARVLRGNYRRDGESFLMSSLTLCKVYGVFLPSLMVPAVTLTSADHYETVKQPVE